MTSANDRMAEAKRNLAEIQALIATCTPTPKKVESGIRRGQKHSGRTLPVPEADRSHSGKRKGINAD